MTKIRTLGFISLVSNFRSLINIENKQEFDSYDFGNIQLDDRATYLRGQIEVQY